MSDLYDPIHLPFTVTLLEEVRELVENANRIVIISHRGPDGDTVGANLALRHALQNQRGKTVISACVDPPPQYAYVLPGCYEYVNDFDENNIDLAIAVDCGAHYMTRFHETKTKLFNKEIPFINIDHHPSNDDFGTHNLVHDTAAAAVFTVYHLLKYLDFKIDRTIATCLMQGLYFDTGSFMHSNTTPAVLHMAADLLNAGADYKPTVKALFQTHPIEQLKLWGRILSRAKLNDKQAVVSAVTQRDLEECGAERTDTGGAIDLLNAVPEGKFSILLSEDGKGNVKGSLRTQNDDIDLSQLAGMFGGGGHKKASGFSIPGRLQPEITWKIVD